MNEGKTTDEKRLLTFTIDPDFVFIRVSAD